MKVVDLTAIVDSISEKTIFSKINRDVFFAIIDKAEINLKQLAAKRKKNDYAPYHDFNFILKELHESKKVDISDACIYLETEVLTVKDILGCLNEENRYSLRISLAERNGIKLKRTSLDNFMY